MKARTIGVFRLRDFESPDMERLCAIDRVCFPPKIACAAKELEQMMRNESVFTIVGESETGVVAGFVIASRSDATSGHIVTLDVLPQFRNRGLGARLMQAAETQLRREGVERLKLETPAPNLPAQQLYRKLGFAQTGFVKNYYPDGSDAWRMEKVIADRRVPGLAKSGAAT